MFIDLLTSDYYLVPEAPTQVDAVNVGETEIRLNWPNVRGNYRLCDRIVFMYLLSLH